MLKKNETTLLVWDLDEKLSDQNDLVHWRSFDSSKSKSIFSIPSLVEENADLYRSKFLSFIYDLGQSKINKKRIVDLLEIRPGFSYWWMTLINEKCNFIKSTQINDIIKIMVFYDLLLENNYQQFILYSSNKQLATAMMILANKLDIKFEWKKNNKTSLKFFKAKKIYKFLPLRVQGFIWIIRHIASFWRFKGLGVNEWKNSTAKTTFISYLFNLDNETLKNGAFDSYYWTVLPKFLKENKIDSNWLHIYERSSILPNANSAVAAIKQFNKSQEGHQVHTTIHSFISIKILLSVIKDWTKMFKLEKSISQSFKNEFSIYWPFLKKDLSNSLLGPVCVSNLLNLHLFEEAINDLPKQEKGIYLQENQSWEFAFIYFWRSAGHKSNLLGVPHSVIRFWDLRYFFASQHYLLNKKDLLPLPLPDKVGINGLMAKKMFLDSGFPKDKLAEVEALRYLHLIDKVEQYKISDDSLIFNKILVLGDYVKENTAQQMQLLDKALKNTNKNNLYIVKPHPACPIYEKDYPEINMIVSNNPIQKIIKDCSLVYVSCMTSAAVDAYCEDKPVVSVLDPKSLNLSPLKGTDGVTFISNSLQLAKVINEIEKIPKSKNTEQKFFYLDYKIPRWRQLLNS